MTCSQKPNSVAGVVEGVEVVLRAVTPVEGKRNAKQEAEDGTA